MNHRNPPGRPAVLRPQIESLLASGQRASVIAHHLACDLSYVEKVISGTTRYTLRDPTMPYADDDAQHVRDCLRHGGFPVAVSAGGVTRWLGHDGKRWSGVGR